MSKRNRELQRLPSEASEREALRKRAEEHRRKLECSREFKYPPDTDFGAPDPDFGTLRALLGVMKDADAVDASVVPKRGPRPKRETLVRILDILEREGLPIRTGNRSPVVDAVANRIGLSPAQARDLLHQLMDMKGKLHPAKRNIPPRA